MKGGVEEVTKDLPGVSGLGLIARVRDAVGAESN